MAALPPSRSSPTTSRSRAGGQARQPPGTLALVPHAKPIAQRSSALHAPVPQHPPDPATEWEAAHAEAESLKARAAAQGALNPRSSPFDEYVQRKRHEKASSAADYVAGRLGTTREQEEWGWAKQQSGEYRRADDAGGAKIYRIRRRPPTRVVLLVMEVAVEVVLATDQR